MLKNRRNITILISILLLFVIAIVLIATTNHVTNLAKQNQETQTLKGTPDFSYDVYSNTNNKIMLLIKVVDEEGISEIKYPNNETIINGNGKQTIAIDYPIQEKTDYTFHITNEKGEEKDRTIRIDNLDDWVKIDVTSEKELDIKVNVEITYGREEIRQYAIGANNEKWQSYNGAFELSSYTVIDNNWGNEDGTVTIKARLLDSVGNKIQIERKIDCLDIDIPKAPVIKQTSAASYPILTEYGVVIDAKVAIQYDTRDDITNYYSTNDGRTWTEYTGETQVKSVNVMAKSVKKASGLEKSSKIAFTATAKDAVEKEVYDGNYNSFAVIDNDKLKVDATIHGKKIIVTNPADAKLTFKDSSGTILSSKTVGISGNINTHTTTVTIPNNTAEILFNGYRVCEITVVNDAIIHTTKHYPVLMEYGVKQGYNIVTLEYFPTSVQRLYKIGNGEWKDYNDEEIRMELGQIIYAKGIDQYGKETRAVSSYTAVLPSDALAQSAYDGNYNSFTQIDNDNNDRLKVDATMQGKRIIVQNTGLIRLNFKDSSGTILSYRDSGSSGSANTYTTTITIPANTVEILFTSSGYRLRETILVNDAIIHVTKHYPVLTTNGVKQGYNIVTLEYFPTSVQKLYKIGNGEWKDYNGEEIRLELGQIIYAKGIDKYGKETRAVSSYTAVLPSDALAQAAYDGNYNTFTQIGNDNNDRLKVDATMQGKKITVQNTGLIRLNFKDSSGTILSYRDSGSSGSANTYTTTITIPANTVEILFTSSGYRLREIRVAN